MEKQKQHEHHAVHGIFAGDGEDGRSQDDDREIDEDKLVYHYFFSAFPPI
jgi:hypothetical protein